ncbi:MAG: radical SAM protein [Treponema sp.]|jgi:pyruvate formate lyase activating enzyme|nr:radical SAM protein [Treponema sp.]
MVSVVLRKTSFVDYPALVSSVIFFYGCNLRCPWCHNRELLTEGEAVKIPADNIGPSGIPAKNSVPVDLEKALEHVEKRRKLLGGVVLSGGEPTLYPGLPELTARIKALGLRVKIDTNGMRPDVLEKLFANHETRPDYIAMDLKLAPERYAELSPAGITDPGGHLRRSAELIRLSGIAHEFRSLSLPCFGESDREALAPLAGSSLWRIRPFVPA